MALNYITFNQDYSHLAVGTTKGFRIFTTEPFSKYLDSRDGNASIVEMLFSTSLVALVLSPRRLQIKSTKRDSIISELTFPTTILAIRMNRRRLCVVLEDQMYLYDIQNMKMLHTIETSPNPTAVCALSPSSESCYLAYPLPQKAAVTPAHVPPNSTHISPTSGEILLFDTIKLEAINVVEAHKSPLSHMSFNADGTMLATASDKGTIIRIFSIPAGLKLHQFRRGSMPSRIYSMAFNTTSTLLCVSSASDTVHIFKLDASNVIEGDNSMRPDTSGVASPRENKRSGTLGSYFSADAQDDEHEPVDELRNRKANAGFMGLVRRTSQGVGSSFASNFAGYLPKGVSEIWEPSRDFAWFKIPRAILSQSGSPLRAVVAMSGNLPQVMVITSEGTFYVFGIDLVRGGEGILLRQSTVLDLSSDPVPAIGDY